MGAVIPSLSTDAEPSAAGLEALADTIRAEGVTVIFGETTQSTEVAEALADEVGDDVEIVELFSESLGEDGSGAETYLAMMTTNTELITAALVGVIVPTMIDLFTDAFGSEITRRALIGGLVTATMTSLIGTWVVVRGLAFFGDAMAHGVLPGIALAAVWGFDLTLGAAVSAVVMVFGINLVHRTTRLSDDTGIGLLFVGMLALGVVIISRQSSFSGDLTGSSSATSSASATARSCSASRRSRSRWSASSSGTDRSWRCRSTRRKQRPSACVRRPPTSPCSRCCR